jgi:small subunit ribosomal protein S21
LTNRPDRGIFLSVRRMLPTSVGRLVFTTNPREEAIDGMPGIRVKEGESFESALRRFKKKCEKAGILADLRRHQHFEKPSERRKRKLNAAKRKMMARMKVAD